MKNAETAPSVGIIGLGYVGLSYAVAFAARGCRVVGCDILAGRVATINRGESPLPDILPDAAVAAQTTAGRLIATTEDAPLAGCDALIIAVPTPVNATYDPDLSMVRDATERIGRILRKGQLIVLECTTYPGTTEEILLPQFAATGLVVGRDYFLAYSPERVDPGNRRYTTKNTNKVVGGVTATCLNLAAAFYQQTIVEVLQVSSPRVAEMTKVFENTFRAVNIALVNEMALLCDRMNIDIWEVMDAAATKPFGIMRFNPGPGVGGHCIPLDPFYLAWKAREYDFHTRFIELAGEINNFMPYFVREKLMRTLNSRGLPLKGSKVLMLGMAYKKDVPDWRESPALKIFELLAQGEATVDYHDPFVPSFQDERGQTRHSVPLTARTLSEADCVLIITDHSQTDWASVVRHARVVVDTRNATKNVSEKRDNIVLL